MLSSISFFEEIEKLFDISLREQDCYLYRNRLTTFSSAILIVAEQAIVEREMDREIHINGLFLYSVVQ